ncbi:hypothetical protein K2X30_00995 [bacterium]|jgi:hypothetical protein|nr:hypothetical protein [bacterium]
MRYLKIKHALLWIPLILVFQSCATSKATKPETAPTETTAAATAAASHKPVVPKPFSMGWDGKTPAPKILETATRSHNAYSFYYVEAALLTRSYVEAVAFTAAKKKGLDEALARTSVDRALRESFLRRTCFNIKLASLSVNGAYFKKWKLAVISRGKEHLLSFDGVGEGEKVPDLENLHGYNFVKSGRACTAKAVDLGALIKLRVQTLFDHEAPKAELKWDPQTPPPATP